MTTKREIGGQRLMSATTDVQRESAPGAPALTGPTSRRALLGAGLGVLIGTVATALGRPLGVRANDDQPVLAGNEVTATFTTIVSNKVNDRPVLAGVSQLGTGMIGMSTSSNGVEGTSDSGIGVQGRSNTDKGVYGYSNTGPGVYAYSGDGSGVWGYTGSQNGKAGIVGQAKEAQSYGAYAENLSIGTKAYLAGSAVAVLGLAGNNPDVVAVAAVAGSQATALSVEGKARFDRSGRASVAGGKSFVDVTVQGGLTSGSLVLATPMLNRPGVYVQSAVPNPATSKIRIYLNKVASSSSPTPIAWFVIN